MGVPNMLISRLTSLTSLTGVFSLTLFWVVVLIGRKKGLVNGGHKDQRVEYVVSFKAEERWLGRRNETAS